MAYPCLCLKRGFFLLITKSTPLRRTILQSMLRFFIDALTFIIFHCQKSQKLVKDVIHDLYDPLDRVLFIPEIDPASC